MAGGRHPGLLAVQRAVWVQPNALCVELVFWVRLRGARVCVGSERTAVYQTLSSDSAGQPLGRQQSWSRPVMLQKHKEQDEVACTTHVPCRWLLRHTCEAIQAAHTLTAPESRCPNPSPGAYFSLRRQVSACSCRHPSQVGHSCSLKQPGQGWTEAGTGAGMAINKLVVLRHAWQSQELLRSASLRPAPHAISPSSLPVHTAEYYHRRHSEPEQKAEQWEERTQKAAEAGPDSVTVPAERVHCGQGCAEALCWRAACCGV